ncbi:MAG: tetratricopeptide repeat protein [Candidatus Omnitrophica bacterium]|nr:tetratricopeptide repeat protein [Candidatus Omnitrophota bacterium]MCB9721586.1 tetratricopeptide repeat protein [Candidatus Omnitrophota bacterium]
MKRAVVAFILILAGVFALFTMLDRNGDFVAERDLWRINNRFAKASRDPQIVPDSTFRQIVADYNAFIQQYPESHLARVAHILIGRVYMVKGDLAKGREKYEEVAKLYADEPKIAVEAVADIGRTYAIENNAQGVIQNYERVIREYPLTMHGMQAPILLTKLHASRGDTQRAQDAYRAGIAHYQKLIKEYPGGSTEFNALRSMGTLYLAGGDRRKAIETFGKVLINFSDQKYMTSKRVATIVRTINTVAIVDLKDYDFPLSIYREFIKAHPQHPYRPRFEQIIESIELLKESKVTLDTAPQR